MRAWWFLSLAVLSACVRPAVKPPESTVMPNVSEQTAAACDRVARLVESTPGAEITRTQGTFDDDPFGEQVFVGCRVLIAGSFTALNQQGKGTTSPIAPWVAPPSPDEVLRQSLPTEGWKNEPGWEADGPDGTEVAFRRGSTVCMIVGRWQGGLPPAYAEAYGVGDNDLSLSDRYSIHVGCIDRAEPLRANDSDAEQR